MKLIAMMGGRPLLEKMSSVWPEPFGLTGREAMRHGLEEHTGRLANWPGKHGFGLISPLCIAPSTFQCQGHPIAGSSRGVAGPLERGPDKGASPVLVKKGN
jgi:hypothetical protein